MDMNQARMMSAGSFFLFIFLFGFWLSRSGKPYSVIVLTIHKLISVAAIVWLGITIRRVHQVAALSTVQVLAVILSGLFFLGTIATGGLLSTDKTMPGVVQRLHQITPYLTVLSTAAALYLTM